MVWLLGKLIIKQGIARAFVWKCVCVCVCVCVVLGTVHVKAGRWLWFIEL